MQILITGGTGLIGRHLIPCLLELGHQIIVVTRTLIRLVRFSTLGSRYGKDWKSGSISMTLMP